MKLSILSRKLSEAENTWISIVDWNKHDGGKVGTPGVVKYGTSENDSRTKLTKILIKKGHEVLD
jgi:hypothetical protein